METNDYIEILLNDGTVARLNIVKFEEITVTQGADGLYRDASGNVVSLD